MKVIITYTLALAMGIAVAFGIALLVDLVFPTAPDWVVFWIVCVLWLWRGIGAKRLINRWPRTMPIIQCLSYFAVALGVPFFWSPPHGTILYWVRSVVCGVTMYFSLTELKIALFASTDQIRLAIDGEDLNLHYHFFPSVFNDRFTQIVMALLAIVYVLTTLG